MKPYQEAICAAVVATVVVGVVWMFVDVVRHLLDGPISLASAVPSSSRAPESIVRVSQELKIEEEDKAHAAWLRRRDAEFGRCDAAHGIPILGYNARVTCLRSEAVIFSGEAAP